MVTDEARLASICCSTRGVEYRKIYMFEIKDACLTIGRRTIVRHFSFCAPDGQISVVQGAPRSGKTLLLAAMLGFVPLAEGWVTINGEVLNPSTACFFRAQMAYVPQTFSVPMPTTVAQVLDIVSTGWRKYEGRITIADVQQSWPALALDPQLWQVNFNALTPDVRKRILLSFAVCARHRVLVVDEPTEGQTPEMAAAMMRLIKAEADKGTAVLLTTTSDEVVAEADNTIVLRGVVE